MTTSLKLSADERRILADALPEERAILADWVSVTDDADWECLEAALGQILAARADLNWVTRGSTDYALHGNPKRWVKDYDAEVGRRQETTQANERHLTPKPLAEQVPGAWNFVEPQR